MLSRRHLLSSVPAVATVVAVRRGDLVANTDAPSHDEYVRRVDRTKARLCTSLPTGSFVSGHVFCLPDQPGILVGVSFAMMTRDAWWARPVLLNAKCYGSFRDTDIVSGYEFMDMSMRNARAWRASDPTAWPDRWQLLLDEAVDAILKRATRIA